MHYKN
ncbi:uncharacterized protein FFFS_16004 [Fusarium fujikuroi]